MSNVINASEVFRETKAFNIMASMSVRRIIDLRTRITHDVAILEYPDGTFKKSDLKILDEILETKLQELR